MKTTLRGRSYTPKYNKNIWSKNIYNTYKALIPLDIRLSTF